MYGNTFAHNLRFDARCSSTLTTNNQMHTIIQRHIANVIACQQIVPIGKAANLLVGGPLLSAHQTCCAEVLHMPTYKYLIWFDSSLVLYAARMNEIGRITRRGVWRSHNEKNHPPARKHSILFVCANTQRATHRTASFMTVHKIVCAIAELYYVLLCLLLCARQCQRRGEDGFTCVWLALAFSLSLCNSHLYSQQGNLCRGLHNFRRSLPHTHNKTIKGEIGVVDK